MNKQPKASTTDGSPVTGGFFQNGFTSVSLQAGPALPDNLRWFSPLVANILVSAELSGQVPASDLHPQDILLYARADGAQSAVPLVWREGGGLHYALDMVRWLTSMRLEKYRSPHRKPWSARLPFHYKKIPKIIRGQAEFLIGYLRTKDEEGEIFTPFNVGGEVLTALWQNSSGKEAMVVLTHDMESADGFPWVHKIQQMEFRYQCRSAWFIVPCFYPIDTKVLDLLHHSGQEVALHGIWHSNEEAFLPKERMRKEFSLLRPFMDRYGILGYRGPSWYRSEELYHVLPEFFRYDASVLDNDFSCPAMVGGVASSHPFRRDGGLWVLPCTLPFEAPLFRGVSPENLVDYWWPKIAYLRQCGGILLVNTHPEPGYLIRPGMLEAYALLLEKLVATGWRSVLPKEVVDEVNIK